MTVIVAVALSLFAAPSPARNSNESVPVNPAFGVYVTAPWLWLTGPRVPLAGPEAIDSVSTLPLSSVHVSGTVTGVPAAVETATSSHSGATAAPGPV